MPPASTETRNYGAALSLHVLTSKEFTGLLELAEEAMYVKTDAPQMAFVTTSGQWHVDRGGFCRCFENLLRSGRSVQ